MKFTETKIHGSFLIDVDRIGDERGFFGRLWCQKELNDKGLKSHICQSNIGVSVEAGTLRGLHYQISPHREVKLIRCSRGAIFDVIVDLRSWSPTFEQWVGVELNEDNATTLYVPEGCATGYITLCDSTEIYYHATEFYHPESATGVRWDDPRFSIEWPRDIKVISDNDKNWPDS